MNFNNCKTITDFSIDSPAGNEADQSTMQSMNWRGSNHANHPLLNVKVKNKEFKFGNA